jgi:DNA-binding MarR family transcriptional regulator
MNEVVTALERGGLIVRAPDENHRRILRTELTDKGSKVLAACDRSVTRMEDTMLEGLSERQRDELLRGLLSCVQQLGAGFPEL